MAKIEIEISASSDKQIYISPRTAIKSISKKNSSIEYGEEFASLNSVKELLDTIVEDGKPSFLLEWKPDAKYKSLFTNLKGSKDPFKIFIYFSKRDGDGKTMWFINATAVKSKVKNAVGAGSKKDVVQKVSIEFEMLNVGEAQIPNP